jgi:hypothetical protein
LTLAAGSAYFDLASAVCIAGAGEDVAACPSRFAPARCGGRIVVRLKGKAEIGACARQKFQPGNLPELYA